MYSKIILTRSNSINGQFGIIMVVSVVSRGCCKKCLIFHIGGGEW